jgi:hypothetical protein
MMMIPKMTFRQIVEQYVDSRKATPISTNHALRALKSAIPGCALSDRELVDMVAEFAVARGRSVHFDTRKNRVSADEPRESRHRA